jgi:1A family penicillin-binding protein
MNKQPARRLGGPAKINLLRLIGKPIYLAFLYSTAIAVSIFLALPIIASNIPRLLKKTFSDNLKLISKPKSPKIKINLPHFKAPKIKIPKIKFPSTNIKLLRLKISPPKTPKIKLSFNWKLIPILVFLSLISYISYFIYDQIFKDLPSTEDLLKRNQQLTTIITDRNGEELFKIYADQNRTPIKLEELSDYTKNAFIAIEDKDFYSHQGFSLRGIIRALTRNLNLLTDCSLEGYGCQMEGGSTITQQLIKNALLNHEKTWQRKVKELILAVQTEINFDKNTILEMYLNEVGFGGPAYGIQEASRQYFDANASNLTLAQSAFLAGLPQAPSKYSPYISPQAAIARQHLVLLKMRELGFISAEEMDKAIKEEFKIRPPVIEIKAPHFVMFVRDLLVDQYGEALVTHGGLKVKTSLDLNTQEIAQNAVNQEIEKLKNLNVSNGAALITNPKTGEILAMIGSKNYFDTEGDGQVNVTTSLRQPGSSIKTINYALALENGLTPATLIKDEPISFKIGNEVWTPKNYDNRFHGTISLRQALANSYNIPAVKILNQNGIANMANLAKELGITSWNDSARFGLSMTLGSLEVKMIDMARVYGTFANYGLNTPLNPILEVTDVHGNNLPFLTCFKKTNFNLQSRGFDCSPKQTISKETAYLITDILSDNRARSAAFGINSVLNIKDHQVAVKTGTSNDLKDNWTIGYTSDFIVAVWVGNNDNTPMSRVASGITGASPIWHNIMATVLEENKEKNTNFIAPDNLIKVSVCTLTGNLTCKECPFVREEYFIKGKEPKFSCSATQINAILNKDKKEEKKDQNS